MIIIVLILTDLVNMKLYNLLTENNTRSFWNIFDVKEESMFGYEYSKEPGKNSGILKTSINFYKTKIDFIDVYEIVIIKWVNKKLI